MVKPDFDAKMNNYGIDRFFGFAETPFAYKTDLAFYYPAPSQIRILKKITQQYETDWVRMVIVGRKGVGKMTLAVKLSSLLAQDGKVEPIIIMPQNLGREGSLRVFLEYFQIPWCGSFNTGIQALKDYLVAQTKKNKPAFLILHRNRVKFSAENIAILRELLELSFEDQPVFHFVWFTDEEPNDSTEPVSQLMKDYTLLTDLPFFEMVEMVNFRCLVAGRSQPFFTSSAYNSIYAHTKGNPGMTVRLCLFAMDETRIQMKAFCDWEEIENAWNRWFARDLYFE